MRQRCLNKNNPNFPRYGRRGIVICDRWLNSFKMFVEDMGERPSKNNSIDIINNDGNYEPDNCRWATYTEQNNNRRCFIKTLSNDKCIEIRNLYKTKKYSQRKLASMFNTGKTNIGTIIKT